MTDERVIVFGTINNGSSSYQNPQKVFLVVTFIGNTSKAYPWPWQDHSSSRPVYTASVYTTNKSFVTNISNIAFSGSFNVTAKVANSSDSSSSTRFEVENPYTTTFAYAFYLGTVLLVIYLFILTIGTFHAGAIQIATFIFLSGYVITILSSLAFIDVELGPNSPIGLVLKHSVDQRGQIKLDNTGKPIGESSWVLNVGGTQETNYTSGIQIPVYVIVFGLLGGYLRYLYETATTARENIEEEYKKIDEFVNSYTPQRLNEVDTIPSGFDRTFRKGYVKRIEEMKKNNQLDPLKIQKYILKRSVERRYLLFNSLKNLALLLLAPLLAAAIWFLLVQAGIEDQPDITRGQTGIFILATISFTIGLVTNESIQLLINFTKDRFGRIRDDVSTKPELSISIEDIQNPIIHGEEQKVTVGVNHNGSAIEEALIRATVINKDSKTIYKFPGFTDNSGRFTYGWRIEPHIYAAGIYTVKLDVSKEGYRSSFITITFEVSNTQKTQINA
jgi:hypothetical protein